MPGSNGQPDYFTLSGTSMASPAVAGAAALLLRENHALSVNTLKISLQFTARLLPLTDVLTQGAGALNIPGALTLADAINPNVPRGTNWIRHRLTAANRDAAGNVDSTGAAASFTAIASCGRGTPSCTCSAGTTTWSGPTTRCRQHRLGQPAGNIVWGNDDNIVWGNGDNIVWGNDDNIVWGNAADDNIVWGNDESDNIVWGIDDNIVWGNADNIVWGNSDDDNIVWGNSHLREVWASNVVAGFWDDNIVWGNITRATETTSSGVTTTTTSCGATALRPSPTTSSGAMATTSSGVTARTLDFARGEQHRVGQCGADRRETLMEETVILQDWRSQRWHSRRSFTNIRAVARNSLTQCAGFSPYMNTIP